MISVKKFASGLYLQVRHYLGSKESFLEFHKKIAQKGKLQKHTPLYTSETHHIHPNSSSRHFEHPRAKTAHHHLRSNQDKYENGQSRS